MNSIKTEGIILRRTNYSEADRILNILTPDHGIVSAIAKGVRKSKSKLAGGLEIFATTDLTILQGKGELMLISSARMKEFYNNLLSDYDRMQFAYETLKSSTKVARSVDEPDFYYLQRDVFVWLNDLSIDWRLSELCYRLRLARLLGHGVNLQYSAGGEKLSADARYNYDTAELGFVENSNGRFMSSHIKLLRLASIKPPAVLTQVGGIEDIIADCVWVSRVATE